MIQKADNHRGTNKTYKNTHCRKKYIVGKDSYIFLFCDLTVKGTLSELMD